MPYIKRLLVVNRGEIAVRVLSTARELGLHTVAVYTDGDASHTSHAHEAVQLPNAACFLNVGHLVSLCKKHKFDLVHPGYGFLSESAEFCEQLTSAGITFIGPGADILRQTGDKLSARKLAESCHVPVLPALTEPTDQIEPIAEFARKAGWPIMLKAVDGGGGRGIRLVNREEDLDSLFQRATNESPSRKIFAEKAAVGDYRHVEVQILGDGKDVCHFWERECSIQRRYQKIVEIAPSIIRDRRLVASVIGSAVRMAKRINYRYLGTWEFLVSPEDATFHFMETNPRLQVEHTITETLCGVDLVRYQLLVALGKSLKELQIRPPSCTELPPRMNAIQMRLNAEDPKQTFSLSTGRINSVSLPGGNGVRLDTHVKPGVIVSTDFDSLLAKIIVSSSDWDATVGKALRALEDIHIEGVTTNIDLLHGIILSDDFQEGKCDTQWLERNLDWILESKSRLGTLLAGSTTSPSTVSSDPVKPTAPSASLIKKGDTFEVRLSKLGLDKTFSDAVRVTKIMRNDFPNALAAEFSSAQINSNDTEQSTQPYRIVISQSSGLNTSASGRQGSPKDPSHLICPLAGELVELLVDDGDIVSEWQPVAIIRQMKMELEVRAHKQGTISSLWDLEEGDQVSAGMLVCCINSEQPSSKL